MAAVWLLCLTAGPLTGGQEPDISKPDNADKVARQARELSEKLIRNESAGKNLMQRIVDEMEAVESRLLRGFDPGPETQEMQRKIIRELDLAIRSAVRRGSGGSDGGGSGDMRRSDRKAGAEADSGSSGSGGDGLDSGSAESSPAEDVRRGRFSGPLRELRRGWGLLPPRDREEVIQGAGEESLERFRDWIERYYRDLAENERE